MIMGELSDGSLQPPVALPIAIKAKKRGLKLFSFLSRIKEAAIVSYFRTFMVSKMFKKLLIFWKVKEINQQQLILGPNSIKI
jgi:hypothetical protein